MSSALLNKIKEGILDILLPKFCFGCGREGLYICKDCEVFLSEVEITPGVDGKTPGVGTPMSVWEYEGLMEKLIYKIKFDGCYDIINELIEKAMDRIELNLPEDTVITYVPMWPKKERQRGFNQSGVIAKAIGKVVLHRVEHILEKVRDNRSQVGLGPKEREENVRGVFCLLALGANRSVGTECQQMCRQNVPRNVLLVDDVYTTGATIKECAKTLRKAGVKNIWVFTLARKMRL